MFLSYLKSKIKARLRTMRHRLSKHLYREAMLKKKGIEYRAKEIKILGLGSSHCTRGFNTDLIPDAFNLSNVDQDLYTSHWLFDKYINSLTHLEKLVFFFSIHTPGHELCKTTSIKNTAVNHYVFGVPYDVDWLGKWRRAAQHRLKTFNDSDVDYDHFSGYIPEEQKEGIEKMPADFRVSHHLRENQRKIKQMHHLFDMYETCKKHHVKIFIVIAPMRQDYRHELKKLPYSDDELFRDLFPWTQKNKIPVLNLLRSEEFKDCDFDDCDHLNKLGATKLTKKILKFLKTK